MEANLAWNLKGALNPEELGGWHASIFLIFFSLRVGVIPEPSV